MTVTKQSRINTNEYHHLVAILKIWEIHCINIYVKIKLKILIYRQMYYIWKYFIAFMAIASVPDSNHMLCDYMSKLSISRQHDENHSNDEKLCTIMSELSMTKPTLNEILYQ